MSPFKKCLLLPVILFALCQAEIVQYTPIPSKYLGFGDSVGQGLLLEPFYDPLCPDSRDSDGYLQAAISKYKLGPSNGLYIRYHLQAMPFHVNSYFVCKAVQIVNTLYGADKAHKALQVGWQNLDNWSTATTANMSEDKIVQTISQTYEGVFGINSATFENLWSSTYLTAAVKDALQYAAQRQIYGVPLYLANGVLVDGADGFKEEDWVKFFQEFGIIKS
jgi:hypothetical protein